MTRSILEKGIWHLNKNWLNQKVSIIANNCTAYCIVPKLNSIELLSLSPNCTTLAQGFIQNLKLNYQNLLLKDFIVAIDVRNNFTYLCQMLCYIDKNWYMISKIIKNCFRNAWPTKREANFKDYNNDYNDVPLFKLAQKLQIDTK